MKIVKRRYGNTVIVLCGILLFITIKTTSGQASFGCGFKSSGGANYESSARRNSDADASAMNIPVVFHIVYTNNEQLVSEEQIHSQLEVINQDFSGNNVDAAEIVQQFQAVAGDPDLRFYLAGITRTETSHGPFSNDDLHLTSGGGKDAWDAEKYLNVWIADLGSQLYGYASDPGAPAFRDGVAIHHAFFGKKSGTTNLGRTLTHEIGHWLGLKHLWGNGGCDSDDGISDTPLQDYPVAGCDLDYSSCGGLNMVQNFMNSSVDACMNMFTVEQSLRMRQTLTDSRPDVFTRGDLITGIERHAFVKNIYPNPLTRGTFVTMEIDVASEAVSVDVYDVTGLTVSTSVIRPPERSVKIDFSEQPDGLYVARIKHPSTELVTRIVVNRNSRSY